MDERFLRSCYCGKHKVLGLNLKPYSLSHLLALEAIKSPLVQSGTRGTPANLVSAVRICSETQFVRAPETFKRPRKHLYDQYAFERINRDRARFLREARSFYDYLAAYSQHPEFWDKKKSLNDDTGLPDEVPYSLTGPYVLAQACVVMMHYPNLTEERVWTMPIGLLSWYNGQISEFKYQARFWNDEEESRIKAGIELAKSQITPEMLASVDRLNKYHASKKGGGLPPGVQTTRIGERVNHA